MMPTNRYNSASELSNSQRKFCNRRNRKGAIAVLAAVLIVIMFGMVAFAIDTGYLALARTETQRTADATAHAAVVEFASSQDINEITKRARSVASEFTSSNPVLGQVASVAPNVDVSIGHYEFGSGQSELKFDDPTKYNAVKVRIRRTSSQNGAVPLFFGGILNRSEQDVDAEATAALVRDVKGFKIPPSGKNVPMLPITIEEDYWDQSHESDADVWGYDPKTGQVTAEADGIPELRLFPNETGSSGNLGTVNIGVTNNSTSYISKQIRNGLSRADLQFHGGSLELNPLGTLYLSGNPGLSAAMKDDLESIIGEVRVVPVYRSVWGNGNNAMFEIVKFVAVRIMAVKLTGGEKAINVQPASLTLEGLIQGDGAQTSAGVFSSPRIVH
ncbi:pilus assembly protein TadG-related protein [Novipirellula maiorica]|uniref:pilus assembly protein TadG-related protein n=1 Tax=Novipirellula maiorica TaxID=1265734 RepID=UPI0009DAEBCC|nr:pilus assembly protein TadG-related protein [Rhodopirellula maiorica]